MTQTNVQPVLNQDNSQQGVLLGVVLDLSGSMYNSLRNNEKNQYSRIESFSKAFQQVLEDAQLLMNDDVLKEKMKIRMFIHGFGFLISEEQTMSNSIRDIFTILMDIEEKLNHYRPLQAELASFWQNEVAQVLEEGRITGDAKEELKLFVERELREQAIKAEQQRSVARFQRWCASICQRIDRYDARIRMQLALYKGPALLLLPLAISLLWLLRGPMLLLELLNRLFEAWLQQKLTDFQRNADRYASQQAEKVVAVTHKALAKYSREIFQVIEEKIIDFFDEEAFLKIALYDNKFTKIGDNISDRNKIKVMYESVSQKIVTIMSPQANGAWARSVFLLRRAAKALRITPDWNLLKEKTIRCAHQVVWQSTVPIVRERAKVLAKERFMRAVLMTIVQAAKDRECTLSLQEIAHLLQSMDNKVHPTLQELPIFGSSPLGFALVQTFLRLRRELFLPQNRGFRPAIVIISDGLPTDIGVVDIYTQAENIKTYGIPIFCCYITNRNVGRPWILQRYAGWFWPKAAHLMFSMASSVDEWPQVGKSLEGSRFVVKQHAKLFVQVNHAAYLQNLIEAILLPTYNE